MTRSDTATPDPAGPLHRHDPDLKVPGTFRFDLASGAAPSGPGAASAGLVAPGVAAPAHPAAPSLVAASGLAAGHQVSSRPRAVTPFGAPTLRDATLFAHLPETPLVLELRRRALTRESRA